MRVSVFNRLCVVFAGVVALCVASVTLATSDPNDPYYKNSSLLQYESFISQSGSVPIDSCFSTGKIIWNYSELDQTYMPGTISADNVPPPPSKKLQAILSNAGTISAAAAALLFAPISIPTLAFLGAEILTMIDICTNTYVIRPHEYYNQKSGKRCSSKSGIVSYDDREYLTSTDVPFFYHCNPLYDPIADRHLSVGNSKDAGAVGRTYGYMGAASQFCTGSLAKYGDDAEKNSLVSRIVVESAGGLIFRSFVGYNTDCTEDGKRSRSVFRAGNENYVYPAFLYAYYKLFDSTGKIQMCVASTRTMLTLRAACGDVAPPGDESTIDPFLQAYVSGTRCEYLLGPRKDLQSLGKALDTSDQVGLSRKSVKLFLQSDFHFTSTVVGCLKDMLLKVFISQPPMYQKGQIPNYGERKSFFQKVQERLKQIVLTILVLYVCVVGLKMITSPEPPKRAEMIMLVLKFALVFYFATGDALYNTNQNGAVTGIVPSLLSATDDLANMFLAAQNNNEPLGLCTYMYNGKNLLGENMYQSGNIVNTVGQQGVKLTLWDLVDCKLISYLNMGSCSYTVGGLMMAWISYVAFFVSGIGILLAIVSLVYCMLILLVIFKFAHISILALITITVLLFLAPIFIPMALFEATKGIFQKWLTTILGYLIYPALLFAFLAIMLATMDKVYYGDLKLGGNNGEPFNVQAACKDVDSIYCYTMGNLVTNSNDACDLEPGTLASNYVSNKSIQYVGSKPSLKEDFANGILPLMMKLLLFAFLFYMFIGSVTQFLAALLGVQDVGQHAHGAINLGNLLNIAGFGAVTAVGKGLGLMKKDKS